MNFGQESFVDQFTGQIGLVHGPVLWDLKHACLSGKKWKWMNGKSEPEKKWKKNHLDRSPDRIEVLCTFI